MTSVDSSVRATRTPFFSRSDVRSLVITASLVLAFRWCVASPYEVPTPSMEPTIKVGDRVVGNHLAYRLRLPFTNVTLLTWAEPARGDIVIFASQTESGINLVKRVVAVAGDTVSYRGDELYINGERQALRDSDDDRSILADATDHPDDKHLFREDLSGHWHWILHDQPYERRFANWPEAGAAYVVPAGSVFVSGDNRDNSSDSRVFGAVPIDAVYGRATRIAWSAYVPDGRNWPALRFARFGAALDG